MIDFRYHIVSLISVFLALAVGIVLGAGPLRDYIAESLSGQVEQLREETEDLREQLDGSAASLQDAAGFIAAAGPALTEGVLPDYPVSIVAFPGVEDELIDAVHDRLAEAGARVENTLTLTEDLIDPAKRPFRSGIGSNLTSYMDPGPAADVSAEVIIGQALDQALTGYDPAAPKEPSADGLAILELLRSSELVTHEGDLSPSLLTVILTPETLVDEGEQAAGLGLIKGTSAERTVIAGTLGPETLLELVRTDSDASGAYSSVDSIDTLAGQIILPRALAHLVSGETQTYGFADGAIILPPDVGLKEPEPVKPQKPKDEDDDAEDSDAEEEADASGTISLEVAA